MTGKDCENDLRAVTERHRAWLRGHSARVGQGILAFLLLSRTFSFAVGCGPSPGQRGGKCEDNGCNTYCESGLHCDNSSNTCTVGDFGASGPSEPPSGCASLLDDTCGANVGYRCFGGSTPEGTCTGSATEDGGAAIYCCSPRCRVDPTFLACPSPATSHWCDDPLTPDNDDAGTSCLKFPPAFRAHAYCCAPDDTCFAGPSDLLIPCASPSEQYFCTGATASPYGKTCTSVAIDAGEGIRGFCCPDATDAGDAGHVTDGGDSTDASDATGAADAP